MSYCRFSSDNFNCDVYAYEDVSGGFTVHIANNKARSHPSGLPKPTLPELKPGAIHAYMARSAHLHAWLKNAYRSPPGFSRDGQSFNVSTPTECAELLEDLKREGYAVPQFAIDALHEEALTWKPEEQ